MSYRLNIVSDDSLCWHWSEMCRSVMSSWNFSLSASYRSVWNRLRCSYQFDIYFFFVAARLSCSHLSNIQWIEKFITLSSPLIIDSEIHGQERPESSECSFFLFLNDDLLIKHKKVKFNENSSTVSSDFLRIFQCYCLCSWFRFGRSQRPRVLYNIVSKILNFLWNYLSLN